MLAGNEGELKGLVVAVGLIRSAEFGYAQMWQIDKIKSM